jgi:ribosome-associated toxin RatA of RatAB toxin-antitoxin module
VTAQIFTPVSRECLWKVLTDYDHLEEFIPHIQESRLVKKDDLKELLLYQKAALWIGFYFLRTEVTFEVTESPKREVHFKAIEGDFRIHEGSWHLKEVPGGTLLIYEATIEPNFWVPWWVLKALERQILKNTFRAILKRCR